MEGKPLLDGFIIHIGRIFPALPFPSLPLRKRKSIFHAKDLGSSWELLRKKKSARSFYLENKEPMDSTLRDLQVMGGIDEGEGKRELVEWSCSMLREKLQGHMFLPALHPEVELSLLMGKKLLALNTYTLRTSHLLEHPQWDREALLHFLLHP